MTLNTHVKNQHASLRAGWADAVAAGVGLPIALPTSHRLASSFAFSIIAILVFLSFSTTLRAQSNIDLAGPWQVMLDPQGELGAELPAADAAAYQPVTLPGSLRDSGLGDPVGPDTHWIGNERPELLERPEYKKYQDPKQFKMPFWLQPQRHYVGLAHYRRDVEIPESWRGRRVRLVLERPHWRTQIFVDGRSAGGNDSLSIPHVYDLTKQLPPGRHVLTISVDNSLSALDVGVNSHSVSDHTQTAWHGIVGQIVLSESPPVGLEDIQVYPAEDARSARVTLRVVNAAGGDVPESVQLRALQAGQVLGERTVKLSGTGAEAAVDCTLPFTREAQRWDEFDPQLCQLEVTLPSYGNIGERVCFGVRQITTRGTQFILNGRPLFLRGTLECCIFPRTGYPPTDVESWKRIIRICKSHGLNHIRFHSWCPPEAAFAAADELGFYYQVECSTWPNQSTTLGDGRPVDEWLYREGQRVLDGYGNHPSFLLLAMGNEPGGPQRGGKYLGPWVQQFKAQTDRQLVTAGSGWPSIAENEFHVTPAPRIQQWGQGVRSRINALPPATVVDYRDFVTQHTVPVISHEIGQWCVYPNFDEIQKYTGSLQPRNFEIFRELLEDAQMSDQAHDFLMASGKLQALCYKEEIESALRTPGFGGFQLLDLHDFPGQGTALVGMLDPFWDSKPYLTPAEFRSFCGPTIPLARMAKRSWTTDETFAAEIELSHFGPADLPAATPRWSLFLGDQVVASGQLAQCDVPTGSLTPLGRIEWPLASLQAPAKLTLEVAVGQDDGCANRWDLWVYPVTVDAAPVQEVMVVSSLTDQAQTRLQQGGKVVLLANPNSVQTDVQIGFSSIFWNTAWTGGQAPHTLGLLCDPAHPALAAFPTDYHSDWQWWSIVSRSKPMVLDGLPPELRPLVQVVPDWFRPQRLGLALEAKLGEGKLLVCSADLTNDLDQRPAARQFRRSLLQYAASDAFAPQISVELASIQALFREVPLLQRLGARVQADSSHADYPAENAIDGDPKTIWHTDWEPAPAPLPHSLVIELDEARPIQGLRYLPRQDMTNGRIHEYAVSLSNDGQSWEEVAAGTFPPGAAAQTIRFAAPRPARMIRLTAKSEVKGNPHTSIAEVDVLFPDP